MLTFGHWQFRRLGPLGTYDEIRKDYHFVIMQGNRYYTSPNP